MRRITLGVALMLVVAACSPAGASRSSGPTTSGTTATPAAATATVSPSGGSLGLDTDEPCTRTIPAGADPVDTGFRAEDLPRMVLTQADFAATGLTLSAWDVPGYVGNAALQTVSVRPPTLCEDLQRFGRINGYASSFNNEGDYQSSHVLSSSVHLFWDAAGARGWSDAFLAGLQQTVGAPGGPTRLDISPIEGLPDGSSLVTYEGPAGSRTWATVVDGPVVGWVVDVHDTLAPEGVDLAALARVLAGRIDAVRSDVASRTRDHLDIAALQSAPLRLAAYGERYADLEWDAGRGGLTEAHELACTSADAPAPDPGRVSGAAGVFGPPSGMQLSEVVRVFSTVEVMADDAAASDRLRQDLVDREALGGQRFDPGAIGDERVGIVTPPHKASGGCEVLRTETLVMTRIGDVLTTVVIQERSTADMTSLVADLAARLADRVAARLPTAAD